MSGGTLLMRAINEGDTSIGMLVRSTDSAYRQIRNEAARIEVGAGARMVDILANRDLAFCIRPRALSADRRCGPWQRWAATCLRPLYGDLATALLALEAIVNVQGAYGGAQQVPIDQFLQSRDRATGLARR